MSKIEQFHVTNPITLGPNVKILISKRVCDAGYRSSNAMSKIEQFCVSGSITLIYRIVTLSKNRTEERIMNQLQQVFVNVSGIDQNEGASIVFAWCCNKGPEDFLLLGSGHVVDVPANARPPGIEQGQYSVTFLLPQGCSVDDVFVTDDKSASERLTGVTVTEGSGHSRTPLKESASDTNDPTLLQKRSALSSSTTLNRRSESC